MEGEEQLNLAPPAPPPPPSPTPLSLSLSASKTGSHKRCVVPCRYPGSGMCAQVLLPGMSNTGYFGAARQGKAGVVDVLLGKREVRAGAVVRLPAESD